MQASFSFRRLLPSVVVAVAACAPGPVFGDLLGSNNWHLNSPLWMRANADVVCKVRVTKVRDAGLAPSYLFRSEANVRREIATAEVISLIEGNCPPQIEIEYEYPRGGHWVSGSPIGQEFTKLDPGESCLVFLQSSSGTYHLGRIQNKARVVAARVLYTLGDEPLLRLLAEFLAGADCPDEMVRLQAIEELGYVGDELMKQLQPFKSRDEPGARIAHALREAQRVIRKARPSTDFVIGSVAVMSSFKLVDPPALDEVVQVLRADPNGFAPAASEAKYGIRDFSVSSLQKRLLETMDSTTRRSIKSLDDGETIRAPGRHGDIYRGVPGFPYARFYRVALATDAVARDAEMRRSIANVIWIRYEKAGVPEMIRLLGDSEINIRRIAVSALDKCINGNFSNGWDRDTFYRRGVGPGAPGLTAEKPLEEQLRDYELNEREYIQYWKDWWGENRSKYEGTVDDYGATFRPDMEN